MNNITTYNNIDETVSEETKRVLNDFNTKLSPEKIEEVEEKVRRRIRVLLSIGQEEKEMKLFIEELVRAFTLYPLKNSIFKKLEEIINEVQELFEYESKGEHKQKYSHINRSKNFWEEIWKKIEKNCTEFDKIFKEIQKNYSDEKEKGIINKKITPLIKSLEEKLKFFEEIRTTAFTFFSPVQS